MNLFAEWLEADGLGGFASGTVSGIRTRRYHALLLAATTPPTGRMVLVNGFIATVETPAGTFQLGAQRYAPDADDPPDFAARIEKFAHRPWPSWTFRLPDGTRIAQEILVRRGWAAAGVTWRVRGRRRGVKLRVRPLLSGRDAHATHNENAAFRFDAKTARRRVTWAPYDGVPAVVSVADAAYSHEPAWYRGFQYDQERDRGLDFTEDLASPGVLAWDLSAGEAAWALSAEGPGIAGPPRGGSAPALLDEMRATEMRRRAAFPSPLHRAADDYLVRRGRGLTVVAGYPWFTDWGRDTFISLRGLCLAGGRLADARAILLEWAGAVSEGMLPNRFTDEGDTPEFNSVDASLWYVIAVGDYLDAMKAARKRVPQAEVTRLRRAVEAILAGYAGGTRFDIRLDSDGLVAAGVPGVQLTWMDAKAGDWVVTPRIGKPVEIQALWINALRAAERFTDRWRDTCARGLESFRARFWNEAGAHLHDVVDVDHVPGTADAAFRPNQLFAVGGLPFALLEGERARRVVDAVEARLWTPMGPRTLAPGSPGYAPFYVGDRVTRDGAYHQGTAWPWLTGPFVEAWVRVRGGTVAAKREARRRFLKELLAKMEVGPGLGHVTEVADAEAPHTARGCPFQAWSVGELLRLEKLLG
ncbi:MAG: glycogen debranching enzyme family protein [Candidatus Eisenbacteria bacterium]|nr:glycogen debranching enzyme family protein [Candidatus Eisenbacteria bacterium]